jgi:hypothetical protein
VENQLESLVLPNLVEVPLQRRQNQHAPIPPLPRESKLGAVGLSSDRTSAAGGSGGEGLADEESSTEEDDDEEILMNRRWCILLSSDASIYLDIDKVRALTRVKLGDYCFETILRKIVVP